MGSTGQNGMALAEFGQGATGLVSAISQAKAAKAQGEYANAMSEINARNADYQGRDAIDRGNKKSHEYRKDARSAIGAERARLAAQGIDITSGSAVDAIDRAEADVAINTQTIKSNAWREAWGFKSQASSQRAEGFMAKKKGDGLSRDTLLTGGVNFLTHGAKANEYYFGAKSK